MNVCVICSANDVNEKYAKPAQELARLLGKAGHTVIICGVNYGLVKTVADGVQQAGGKVIGVLPEWFAEYGNERADELIVTKSISENKAVLYGKADAVVMLVGGLGTLDEATEILEQKKQSKFDKPLILLNTAGYYNGLKMQLLHMASEGFLPVEERSVVKIRPLTQLVRFADTPAEVLALIQPTRSNIAVTLR